MAQRFYAVEKYYYEIWVNDEDDLIDAFNHEREGEGTNLEFLDNQVDFYDEDWNEVR